MRVRTIGSLLVLFLSFAVNVCATPVHLWSHNYGDSDDQYTDALFTDPAGNVFLVGSFYGSVSIATPYTSLGRRDATAVAEPCGSRLLLFRGSACLASGECVGAIRCDVDATYPDRFPSSGADPASSTPRGYRMSAFRPNTAT